MQKLAERLIDKYLFPMMQETATNIFKRDFESAFKACCLNNTSKDTTLGATFAVLEEKAFKEIKEIIEKLKDNTSVYQIMTKQDNLRDIAYDLLEEFYEYLDIKSYVSSILGDEWWDKQKELEEKGILDEHGDYIKGGEIESIEAN